MKDIDDRIREALKAEKGDESVLKERSMLAEVLTPFRGKRRWVNWLGIFYGLVANVVFVWAVVRFYGTEAASERLHWLLIGGVALLFVTFSKVYFWMEMHTNRVLREVKRVELLVLSKQERKEE